MCVRIGRQSLPAGIAGLPKPIVHSHVGMLIDQLNDSVLRISSDGRLASREGNGQRLLGRLLLDATPTTDTAKKFKGDTLSVDFWTWCEASGGWMTPCRASRNAIEKIPEDWPDLIGVSNTFQ